MRQKGFVPIIIIFVIAILGTVGYLGHKNLDLRSKPGISLKNPKNDSESGKSLDEIIKNSISYISKTYVIEGNLYKDIVHGFTFEIPNGFPIFPESFLVSQGYNKTYVYYYKISELPEKENYYPDEVNKSEGLKIMTNLQNISPTINEMIKDISVGWGWSLNESQKIVSRNGKNIFYATTFAAFDDCSFSFHHNIAFPLTDGFIIINIVGDGEKYKTNLPKYTKISGGGYCWKYESSMTGWEELYADLINNQSDINKDVVNWYNALGTVVNSLYFNNN